MKNSKPKQTKDILPPHSEEAELGALACLMQIVSPSSGEPVNWAEFDSLLMALKPAMFFQTHCAALCIELHKLRSSEPPHCFDVPLLFSWLKDRKRLDDCGGFEFIATLPDKTSSPLRFHEYLEVLKEKWNRRRAIQAAGRVMAVANGSEFTLDAVQQEFAEVYERTQQLGGKRALLKIWKAKELIDHKPPTDLQLVGDNEIAMGYEGVTLVAGPGSSGKSLTISALALAGAIGSGLWMGRKVHRRFKTLIIQAENGSIRLKKEIEAMKAAHPKVDIDGHIFISDPPEGGIPFHSPEFRAAVRHQIIQLKPDLIVLDPWSQVAVEDAAKEVVDKLGEIRSCFPAGENCPGLLIVAHTKKPRPEDVRKGRGLVYLVSGSVALPNTARCVYVLLPWSDDPTDDRVYWCCPKLNNGEMYAPSVWKRRFGTFFEHDSATDPREWGQERDERQAISEEDLITAFENEKVLPTGKLVKRLAKISGAGESTCWRAVSDSEAGYLRSLLMRSPDGKGLKLKAPKA